MYVTPPGPKRHESSDNFESLIVVHFGGLSSFANMFPLRGIVTHPPITL